MQLTGKVSPIPSFCYFCPPPLFFFAVLHRKCGISVPDQGSNPFSPHWKRSLLTTGSPRKSLLAPFLKVLFVCFVCKSNCNSLSFYRVSRWGIGFKPRVASACPARVESQDVRASAGRRAAPWEGPTICSQRWQGSHLPPCTPAPKLRPRDIL